MFAKASKCLVAVLVLASTTSGCRYVLGLDDAPSTSDCVRDRDCKPGNMCQAHQCVVDCRHGGCPPPPDVDAVDASDAVDAPIEASSRDATSERSSDPTAEAADGSTPPDADRETEAEAGCVIDLEQAPVACVGETSTVEIVARNCAAPHKWTLDTPIDGLSVSATAEPVTKLTFAPTAPAILSATVHVENENAPVATRSFDVIARDAPSITTTTSMLPTACNGQPYLARLTAQGGTGSYTWSTPAGSAIAINRDTGEISTKPGTLDPISFKVSVSDGLCARRDQQFTITVNGSGTNLCPTITPPELPMPCSGTAYAFSKFGVLGGGDGPAWRAASPPPAGMTFDPTSHTLHGVLSAPGSFSLEVTSAGGPTAVKTYQLVPRTGCWLAYSSGAPGSLKKMILYDPLTNVTSGAFPANVDLGALDFKFSPDGKFIAMRVQSAVSPASLVLLAGPTWAELPVDVGGDVTTYAWADDSKTLAVVYSTPQGIRLGGVDVAAVSVADASETAPGIASGLRVLASTATPVASELTWSNSYVVFAVPYKTIFQRLSYAQLDSPGFGPATVLSDVSYSPPLAITKAEAGVFVSGAQFLDFHAFPYNHQVNRYPPSLTNAAGRYVARVDSAELQVYTTQTVAAVRPIDPPWVRAAGCGLFLARADARERFGCATDTAPDGGSAGSIRIFDLDASKPALAPGPEILDFNAYSPGVAAGHARAFSRSGNWLALSTSTELFVIALSGGTPWLWDTVGSMDVFGAQDGAKGEIIFAPDESAVLWHHDLTLAFIDLRTRGKHIPFINDPPLQPAPSCTEDYVTRPAAWCGANQEPRTVIWSSDSRWAVASAVSGGLTAWPMPTPGQVDEPRTVCTSSCGGQFSVQPQRSAN